MHISLIAHGAHFSTYDIYNYYKSAIKDFSDVSINAFPLHDVMDYHFAALEKTKPDMNETERLHKAAMGGARDIVSDIVLHEPTHVIFIGGLAISPSIARFIYDMRYKLINKFAIGYIFTESPYQDKEQELYYNHCDFAFFNDKYSSEKYNPTGELCVRYLPHSYHPSVHYAFQGFDNYIYDMVFCGTMYPNRVEFLSTLDYSNIKYRFVGSYVGVDNAHFDFEFGHLNNLQLSDLYRQSKLAINFHREDDTNTAYSVNPRIREAIMCGALPVSDYRQEIYDVFGDTIPIINQNNATEVINRLLSNDEERINRLLEARKRIKDDTYHKRFENIILPVLKEVEEIYGKVSGT